MKNISEDIGEEIIEKLKELLLFLENKYKIVKNEKELIHSH